MPLNLDSLTAKIGAEMPKSTRGRTAEPVPASIVQAVKQTYALPEGQGGSFRVPNGDKNENGKDINVTLVVGQLRKAATQLGYGLSVKVMEPGKASTEILFRAKDKAERTRRTKDEKRHDDLIAAWVDAETAEFDGDEDDEVAVAAWEDYLNMGDDENAE